LELTISDERKNFIMVKTNFVVPYS